MARNKNRGRRWVVVVSRSAVNWPKNLSIMRTEDVTIYIRIYTDGSKNERGISTGAAFVEDTEEGYYISINKRNTLFTAEVLAIAKALQKWESKRKIENIILYSD